MDEVHIPTSLQEAGFDANKNVGDVPIEVLEATLNLLGWPQGYAEALREYQPPVVYTEQAITEFGLAAAADEASQHKDSK